MNLTVHVFETLENDPYQFAVIASVSDGKWVFCRHRERDTFEFPGGHREPGEDIFETAKRELIEETSAAEFEMIPVCAYSVTKEENGLNETSYGMLFFAEISAFDHELHFEIETVLLTETLPDRWTYPEIQSRLLEEIRRRGFS